MKNPEEPFFPERHIIIEKNRIFIDICNSGCGSGCTYCYVPSKNEPQSLLDIDQIEQLCIYIKMHIECSKKIISLCPNTEPLKTNECIQRILYIIKFFLPLGCFVQISTKELVPEYFLNELQKIDERKIYFNVSIPFLSNVEKIEPSAALVEERLNLFKQAYAHPLLNLCLYIKPFIKKNKIEQMQYVKLINKYKIKNVCVGVAFTRDSTELPCLSLYRNTTASDLFVEQSPQINEFVALLRNKTKANIFGSSVCSIYNDHYNTCDLQLSKYDVSLCSDCVVWGTKTP